jgi:hypothetical protein
MVIEVAVITPLLVCPITEIPIPVWIALEVAEPLWIIFVSDANAIV